MNWDRVPDWHFGDVLRCTHPNWQGVVGLFLAWTYTVDWNPTESTCQILVLTDPHGAGTATNPSAGGDGIVQPYCGWWEPVE